MANKRTLKKKISSICGALAADIVLAEYASDKVDCKKVNEILTKIAELQDESLDHASFSFDKVAKDFPSVHAYRKARREYFAQAFKKLRTEFADKANAIVKEMNEVVPAEVRKAVSE